MRFIKIIHREDSIYDVYDKVSGEWLFSRLSADNIFKELAKLDSIEIEFIDEEYQRKT